MCRWTTICAVRVGTYCRRRQYVQNDNMYRHMPLPIDDIDGNIHVLQNSQYIRKTLYNIHVYIQTS